MKYDREGVLLMSSRFIIEDSDMQNAEIRADATRTTCRSAHFVLHINEIKLIGSKCATFYFFLSRNEINSSCQRQRKLATRTTPCIILSDECL